MLRCSSSDVSLCSGSWGLWRSRLPCNSSRHTCYDNMIGRTYVRYLDSLLPRWNDPTWLLQVCSLLPIEFDWARIAL